MSDLIITVDQFSYITELVLKRFVTRIQESGPHASANIDESLDKIEEAVEDLQFHVEGRDTELTHNALIDIAVIAMIEAAADIARETAK